MKAESIQPTPPFTLHPLTAGQHPVSKLPKRTTELPFFYLTKKRALLDRDITYQGVDEAGNLIRWTVRPNRAPEIGVPAIDAHEMWVRVVVPAIEKHQQMLGHVPEILPLGGVRACLRMLGWGSGGHQSRRLLRALNQIGAAWCEADFFLPIEDKKGGVELLPIKGKFSRMSIFAIGEKHLTPDELSAGKFDFAFELESTIYLQLHRLEVAMQENQDHRYIDNQYMFSVEPTGRRWLEIVGPRIFGVVKNAGTHCEIRYSWYVKQHHTLKRHAARFRIVEQMDTVVADHVRAGYILKPEYRAIHEPGEPLDFTIRYVPGPMASESIARVGQHLRGRSVRQATATATRRYLPTQRNSGIAPEIAARDIDELTRRGITEAAAKELLATMKPDQHLLELLEYGDHQIRQNPAAFKNPPGFYVSLIRQNNTPPPSFETRKRREARREGEQAKEQRARLELAYDDYRRDAIDRFLATDVAPEEFEELARSQEAALRSSHPRMPDETIARMARRTARGEITKRVTLLTFGAFCDHERQREADRPASAEAA
jgi:hypothetical protein